MRKISAILLTMTILLVIAGCGSKNNSAAGELVIGSMGSDAQIWKHIAESQAAKDAGLKLEVKEISDGVPLNNATKEGEVDVNAFQSWAYLVSYNKDSKANLVAFDTTYLEPMGIYSDKIKNLADVPEGAEVAIANNPANTARGLKLLEAAGLITLKADFDNGTGSVNDIDSNPKQLSFTLIDDTTGPRVIKDVDLVLIGNTIALEGGLNVLEDSLYYEEISEATKNNINILVTTADKQDNEDIQKLSALYHSEDTQNYIKENFGGTKVEVKKPISYLEEN
ncbi:MetQ/NlpA family ABC transporter substrate-binding protein [Paenibacillus donghaensis]|uniref:Metal ABC transporter substrate-binding protein n=1 Tax=Paenibacillus donghaensis TaxID=414771 RepID=A0A2Z2KH15_9BACL|nr:MetQ/NlpA family ABC transporter substrate-binding protein [Paenibacillus donghaensis]ASA21459.1 metal ABC transporter substrate-binding protein [Paenibacillus donghaensis]